MTRKPIAELFDLEIGSGLVNQDRLEEKVAAFLEFVDGKFQAFDVKTGNQQRLKFNDAVKVSFNNQYGVKKTAFIKSPRFEQGRYVAQSISIEA